MLRKGPGAALVAALSLWSGITPSADAASPPRYAADLVAAPLVDSDGAMATATALLAEELMNVERSQLVRLDELPPVGAAFTLALPIDGEMISIEAAPHDVRSAGYRLIVQGEDGILRDAPAGATRTFRGTVTGRDGAIVAGSLLDDGLHLMIRHADGERVWMEPVATQLPIASPDTYLIYRSSDVAAHDGTCGMPGAEVNLDAVLDRPEVAEALAQGGPISGGLCVAELACDTDVQYFNDYGSVTAVENRITSIINTVNVQYESQVSITHSITAIVVRTAEPDPYSTSDPEDLLCQFNQEWTNNQTGVQRDVAHLFTGRDLAGSVIGIASDIGGSGICVNQGSCTGGPFGPIGSYCLSQSDFNGNFSCATDLTAHELGHLWGAFHCSCPSNTMNPGITCANSFSGGTIASIIAYRDTRSCLDGTCGGVSGPENDFCADAELVPCTTSITLDNTFATPVLNGPDDPDFPGGSPSCQWAGDPDAVHNTLWYSFVADDTSIEIETCSGSTAIEDTIIALYGGTCGNLVELACGEDDCGASTYLSRICYNGLTPGQTYYVMVGNPGSWSGSTPGVIRLDLTCPCPDIGPVAGACCLQDGSCVDAVTSAMCSSMGGTFQGAGSNCGSVDCGPVTGACCFSDGGCAIFSANDCASFGGTYQGDNVTCGQANCPQPTGACCFSDGGCAVFTANDCASFGGTYQGDGVTCGQANCPQPTGACCFDDGSCTVLEQGDCSSSGGIYQGDGVTCGQANCPQPTGACCFDDGSCSVLEQGDCSSSGGIYQGDGVTCGQANCPQPTGACCFDDGSCSVLEEAECASSGGIYQGDDVTCAQANCPQPTGACCLQDGSCVIVEADACAALGGVYQGDDVTCGNADCVQPSGACCFVDGSCADLTAADCDANGGTWQGDFAACASTSCPTLIGACCFPDGSCAEITLDACNANGGIYTADGVTCVQADCPQPTGVCCLADGDCIELTEAECVTIGSFQGVGTTCVDTQCPVPCVGDVNGDDTVDFSDLVSLLSAWGPCIGCPQDLDGNDVVAFSDLVVLLSAWGPCP